MANKAFAIGVPRILTWLQFFRIHRNGQREEASCEGHVLGLISLELGAC